MHPLPNKLQPHVAIIGGGPAGLMAAEILAAGGAAVTVHDRMPSVGRKFLLAGRGGLNLTHSEQLEQFLLRYGEAANELRRAVEAFPPAALRAGARNWASRHSPDQAGGYFPNR